MKHSELVTLAGKWLKSKAGCNIVFTELVTYANESPDAIGWNHFRSFLIECKTSRADFFADMAKAPRRNPSSCMGNFRFYMTPAGLIHTKELPDGWGLIETDNNYVVMVHDPAGWKYTNEMLELGREGLKNERNMMYSALRRMQKGGYLKNIKGSV